jgi:hypothetical protein
VNAGFQAKIRDCVFQQNHARVQGGGILCQWMDNIEMVRCEIRNNSAASHGGGLLHRAGQFYLTNCAVVGNSTAGNGGGIRTSVSNFIMINSTLYDNSASGKGDGLHYETARNDPILTPEGDFLRVNPCSGQVLAAVNCILWNGWERTISLGSGVNGASMLPYDGGDPIDVYWGQYRLPVYEGILFLSFNYNCVQQSAFAPIGQGNITLNPRFSSYGLNGNVHLTNLSPCIDAGDSRIVHGRTSTDLDGNERFVDHEAPNAGTGDPPIVDMGAYEAQ